ncbi:MAG: hypothetical protein QM811_26950 [Pirellulales bacterium]
MDYFEWQEISRDNYFALRSIEPRQNIGIGAQCDIFDFAAIMRTGATKLSVELFNLASVKTMEDLMDNRSITDVTIGFRFISADLNAEHYALVNGFAKKCRGLKRMCLLLDELDDATYSKLTNGLTNCELTLDAETSSGYRPPENLHANINVFLRSFNIVDKKAQTQYSTFSKQQSLNYEQRMQKRITISTGPGSFFPF